jgi:tripartite-type tricarboxylate transporter receptor subunit TctC
MLLHRPMTIGRILAVIGCVLASLLIAAPAGAGEFPQKGKAIQMIVGYAAGGPADTGARILGSGLEKELGTPVVIVNKPGANGQIGLTAVVQAKPDGYTIATSNFPGAITTYLDTERKPAYNRKSFQPLALHVSDPNLFAVKTSSPFKTLKDLVDAAKAKPKGITFTSGILNDDQFFILQFQKLAGVQVAQVTFAQGTAPALTAVLGGKVEVFTGNVGDLLAQFKAGEMRILGIADDEESPFYPGVKTLAAQGYKLIAYSARGFVLPAGTPKQVVDTLSNAFKKVIASDEHKKRMAEMGLTLRFMDPVQYGKYWEEYETMVKELMPLTKE